MIPSKPGKLICVGTGMRMAGQLTPLARSYIETADVVVAAVPNSFARKWLQGIAKEYICLLDCYSDCDIEGKNRHDTYTRMAATIMGEVRSGKSVCAAFYGHPGIFSCISHMAIKDARAEGFSAEMLPGISAEDCLVADLGMDPGATGVQSMEATQFMVYERKVDPTSLLILWQPYIAGDLTRKRFDTSAARLQILVDKLALDYPLDHPVILYEAATHPLETTRIDTIALRQLPDAQLRGVTTLVLPPAAVLQRDERVIAQLSVLEET